jgi:hypothetical protein
MRPQGVNQVTFPLLAEGAVVYFTNRGNVFEALLSDDD